MGRPRPSVRIRPSIEAYVGNATLSASDGTISSSFFIVGLLAGVMYTMVALGFVLIYKASGVFNFAQGAMVLFAALTFVTLSEHGLRVLARLAASARW